MDTKKIEKKKEILDVRGDFPIFQRSFNGKRLVYLDSASSSQKPAAVIEAMNDFYRKHNANIHRGVYALSEEATQLYEDAHSKVASFINAQTEEIVFTRNTTESINLLSYSLGTQVRAGDSIVLTQMEHHSNLVPWQQLAKRVGAKLRFIPIKANGTLDMAAAEALIDETTRIVAATHVSNVLGTINDVAKIGKLARAAGAFSIVDAAQSVPHMPVDAKRTGCDFFAFSGHKMLGPTGIGVLFGRRELLETMEPFITGGGMIRKVTFEGTEWNGLPWKFEGGTPNVSGGVGLGAAVDYLKSLGMDRIKKHEEAVSGYALERMTEMDDMIIYGPEERTGVIAFNIDGVHPHDAAQVLDENAVAIRGGHHCAQPLMGVLRIPACSRASFYVYNDYEDADRLIEGLKKVRQTFRR